jgi:hypothetical protein
MDEEDAKADIEAEINLKDGIYWLLETFKSPKQPYRMFFEKEAGYVYDNWYSNRFSEFGPLVKGYAQRSRAIVARLAMLMAISRRQQMITLPDVEFALGFLRYNMERLEQAMLPPTEEARCVSAVEKCLPGTLPMIIKVLRPSYNSALVAKTIMMMRDCGEIDNREGTWYTKKAKEQNAQQTPDSSA